MCSTLLCIIALIMEIIRSNYGRDALHFLHSGFHRSRRRNSYQVIRHSRRLNLRARKQHNRGFLVILPARNDLPLVPTSPFLSVVSNRKGVRCGLREFIDFGVC